MLKKGIFTFFFVTILFIGFSGFIFSQSENVVTEKFPVQLEINAGTTPDSFFYFLDEFFDRFGDKLEVKEEKIAEIRTMIEVGNFEAARIALDRYYKYADFLEKEISPDRAEEARKSAEAIRLVLNELKDELEEAEKQEFVDDVLEKEDSIITAAEIAAKIKELCETLSRLDPLEYSRVCGTDEKDPKWQKELDEELTEEQRQEAILFGNIMEECFRTSGQQCRCEEIPFKDFAETCSTAAPLAVQCEIEENEQACEELDNLKMPELPPHLQDVFDNLEVEISEAKFELHMPKECREAGATNSKECMKVMIEKHAPEECRQAFAETQPENERRAREICEKIMFEKYAPEECKERGITDHKECSILMFQLNAPQECLNAGLTGEHRSDHEKCETIIHEKEGPNRFGPPALGIRCREIENPEERLTCYDAALGGAQEYKEDFEERFEQNQEAMRQCAERCSSQNAAWTFSSGQCECKAYERFESDQTREGKDFSSTFNVDEMKQRCEAEGGRFVSDNGNYYCRFEEQPTTEITPTEPATSETQTQTTSAGTITGGIVFEFKDNNFLKYFYR